MAVSSPDLKAFLVATPLFGGLSDASLDLLISMLAERRFDDGAIVVAEGEPGRSMYVVHTGELAKSPTVLHELTAQNLYTFYKADIYAYVMLLQNINRELCRRLRHADNRIAEMADGSREPMTQNHPRPVG